jgi:dolichyl-phosphate-mannose--protein O-mannosyl transferase
MWLIKEASTAKSGCEVGVPVQCGDQVRLEHIGTGKNLHSHLFRAPLTGNQEVSGFGEGGKGDTGDNWRIACEAGETYWRRGVPMQLVHVDTSKYLYSTEAAKFTAQNCGQGCPIMGQNEVSASGKKDSKARWVTGQGVFFPPKTGSVNEEL